MTLALTGLGTEFRRWDATSGAWEELAEIKNINFAGYGTRGTVEVVTLDQTDGYSSFIGGFRTPGTLTATMVFRRDTYETIKDDYEDDVARNYEIVLPDDETTTMEFEGLVTELPFTIPPDADITVDITIQVTSKPVTASGSGGTSTPSA